MWTHLKLDMLASAAIGRMTILVPRHKKNEMISSWLDNHLFARELGGCCLQILQVKNAEAGTRSTQSFAFSL
jgi:hypothetical protein